MTSVVVWEACKQVKMDSVYCSDEKLDLALQQTLAGNVNGASTLLNGDEDRVAFQELFRPFVQVFVLSGCGGLL